MHIFLQMLERRTKKEVNKRPRLFLSALLVFLVVLAGIIIISWSPDKSASDGTDRCILLIGGLLETAPLVEYYHPTRDECDMKSIGRMSTTKIDLTYWTSGCYLSDTQQIVIREAWHTKKPPMIYGLRDSSAKQLPYPFKNSSDIHADTIVSATSAISPSKCLSCGGHTISSSMGNFTLEECYQYDSSSPNRWTHIASLPGLICCGTSVSLGTNSYYICGGYGISGRCLKELYRYSISERRWYNETSMGRKRCDHSAAVLSPTEFIVCGGRNDRKDCEVYHATQRKWRRVGSLNVGRKGFAMTTFNGHVYAIGGSRSGSVYLDSVEEYDKRTETWTVVKALKRRRYSFIVAVI